MPPDRADVHEIFAFEAPAPLAPGASGGGAGETLAVDDAVTHRGDHSGRITRDTASPDDFSALNFHLPVDFTGGEIELSRHRSRAWAPTSRRRPQQRRLSG